MQSVGPSLTETYDARPESVAVARTAVANFAADAGASKRQIDDMRLATSEAVTNSVLHAYHGEPGSIQLTIASVGDELWVLIADDGCGLQPRTDRPGLGLGLGLIAQVSDDLSIVPRAGGGTELRMRFMVARSEAPRGRPATRAARGCNASVSLRR
jgi:anti-sigma regulatory factor (Ser/Thr protein kinase)